MLATVSQSLPSQRSLYYDKVRVPVFRSTGSGVVEQLWRVTRMLVSGSMNPVQLHGCHLQVVPGTTVTIRGDARGSYLLLWSFRT